MLTCAHYKSEDFLSRLGPFVQSIVSLTSSLSGQLIKCFTNLKPNTLIFFVEKEIIVVIQILVFEILMKC